VLHDKSTVVQYSSSVVNLIYTRLKNLKLLNYDIGPEEDFFETIQYTDLVNNVGHRHPGVTGAKQNLTQYSN